MPAGRLAVALLAVSLVVFVWSLFHRVSGAVLLAPLELDVAALTLAWSVQYRFGRGHWLAASLAFVAFPAMWWQPTVGLLAAAAALAIIALRPAERRF